MGKDTIQNEAVKSFTKIQNVKKKIKNAAP